MCKKYRGQTTDSAHDYPAQEQWPLTLIGLATNAPEQNPIEDVWLNGKTQIRKHAGLNTFAQVKQCFVDTITANTYNYEKFDW